MSEDGNDGNGNRRHFLPQDHRLLAPYTVEPNMTIPLSSFRGISSLPMNRRGSVGTSDPDMFLQTGFSIQVTNENPTKTVGIYSFFSGKYGFERNVEVKKAKTTSNNKILVARDIKITQSFNDSEVTPRFLAVATSNGFYEVAVEHFGKSFAVFLKNQEAVPPEEDSHDLFFSSAFDIVSGLNYLHENGIVHCDIQPDNIYFLQDQGNNNTQTKIGGLTYASYAEFEAMCGSGHKRVLEEKSWKWKTPEWTSRHVYSQLSDVYSLGCLFFTLMFGDQLRVPYDNMKSDIDTSDMFLKDEAVLTTNRLWLARHLIDLMLQESPGNRPTCKNLKCHPLFWTDQMTLNLFADLTSKIKADYVEQSFDLRNRIDDHSVEVLTRNDKNRTDWTAKFPPALIKTIKESHYKLKGLPPTGLKSDGTTMKVIHEYFISNLIRISARYNDANFFKSSYYSLKPEEYLKFWIGRFPKLTLRVSQVAGSHLKENPTFEQYFRGSSAFHKVQMVK